VLSFGRKIAEGPPEAIRQNPKVQEVYLGRPAGASATAIETSEYKSASYSA
jgi:Branched-chain amino acid ATP-binding cassette transporter